MKTLNVALGKRSYPIYLGSAGEFVPQLAEYISSRPALLVTDENIHRSGHAEHIQTLLQASGVNTCGSLVLPPGEEHKNFQTVENICRAAVAHGLDRHGVMIALSGGVVGDLTGFASAVYMRGIDFIQLPTTLLAAVDSSVGGKTGADLPEGKNLIGAFHQPRMVAMDKNMLKTLPEIEWRNGLAEVVKYGVIMDADFFGKLENNVDKINRFDLDFYEELIYKSCQCKAEVVAEDEQESGRRAILNYGHTAGHAVEKLSDFTIPHGMAVAMGMIVAMHLAIKLDMAPPEAELRQRALLQKLSLPTAVPLDFDPAEIVKAMHNDKKNAGGRITMVLPQSIGGVTVVKGVDEALLSVAIREVME